MNSVIKPRHSNLSVLFFLSVSLFATYLIFVPAIIKQYERQLETERRKLVEVLTRIELHQAKIDKTASDLLKVHRIGEENNRLLREIHDKVFNAQDPAATRKKDQ